MREMPHDTTDVLLAPVALRLDQQLEQLSSFSTEEMTLYVALQTDRRASTADQRHLLLLAALLRDFDVEGWELTWHHRGLCLRHHDRQVVLGIPTSVRAYLDAGDGLTSVPRPTASGESSPTAS